MENVPEWLTLVLGISQALLVLLLGIVGYFVKGLINDLRDNDARIDLLKEEVIVLQTRQEARDGNLDEMKRDVKSLCEDMRWVRDRVQRLPCRQVGRRAADVGCDPD